MKKYLLGALLGCAHIGFSQVKVLSNGNVGIGTVNPQSILFVEQHNLGWMARIKGSANDPGQFVGISLHTGYQGEYGKWAGLAAMSESQHANATGLSFYTSQTERLRINSSGRVGIGTVDPHVPLHIASYNTNLLKLQSTIGGAWNTAGIEFLTYGGNGAPNARIAAEDQGNYAANINFFTQPANCPTCPLRKTFSIDYVGNAYLTGVLHVNQGFNWSDKKLKTSISTANNALEKVLQMRGVYYTAIDSIEIETEEAIVDTSRKNTDTTSRNINPYVNNKTVKTLKKYPYGVTLNNKQQYGFIAQEMEKVLPEAVKDTKYGLKAVNYEAIIPLLVEALKAQNQKVEALEAKVKKLEGKKATTRQEAGQTIVMETIAGAYLYQNTPNPFSQETKIKYYIPETVADAFITVTDLNGKQLKSYTITAKGESYITVKANELSPGLYVYALVADGNIIDTKRMVIVE